MVTYKLLDPHHALMIARADALENYVALEQSLCETFIQISGASNEAGSLVFFRMNNARTQQSILEKLLKPRFYPEFNLFWNSVLRRCGALSETRNQIVHWQSVFKRTIKQGVLNLDSPAEDAWLSPPTHWWGQGGENRISINKIFEFIAECRFISRHVHLFNLVFDAGSIESTGETREEWRQRFLQPIPYPPPADHPLWTPPATFRNPPQS